MLQLQIGWAFIEVSAAALDSVLRHKRSTFQVMICVTSPKCSASSLSVGAVIDSTVGVASSAATGESWAQKPQAMCSDLVKLLWKLQGRLLFVFFAGCNLVCQLSVLSCFTASRQIICAEKQNLAAGVFALLCPSRRDFQMSVPQPHRPPCRPH